MESERTTDVEADAGDDFHHLHSWSKARPSYLDNSDMNAFLAYIANLWRQLFGGPSALSTSCGTIPWNRTKDGIWYMGSTNHRAWQKSTLESGDVWSRLFAAVSGNEGSSAAYQNYDNQGVTLGAGFGARGMLGAYARNLSRPELVPLPDVDGRRYSTALIDRMRSEDFATAYVCGAESVGARKAVLDAQIATFRNSKSRYSLPLDNFPLSYLISHLGHWYPAFVPEGGWSGRDDVDVPRLLGEFRARGKTYAEKHGSSPPSETQIAHYVKTYRRLGGTYVS